MNTPVSIQRVLLLGCAAILAGWAAGPRAVAAPHAAADLAGALKGIDTTDTVEQADAVLDGDVATECVITHDPNQPGDLDAAVVIDLGAPCVVDSVRVVNGQSHPIRWVTEIEIGRDGEHFRALLGRRVNLPMWRGGDTKAIAFPGAVGRYVRVHFGGVRTGSLSELAVTGRANVPERHVLCWSGDLERDFVEALDFFEKELLATDLWVSFGETGFPETTSNGSFAMAADSGILDQFEARGIRWWLNEHEAFTFMVNGPDDLHDEQRWLTTLRQMRDAYGQACALGFRGVVFDAEDYDGVPEDVRKRYEDTADHVDAWTFHEEFGLGGMYYHRGRQVGGAIEAVWPEGIVIQLYEARMYDGIPGCRDGNYWWLKGIHDAGVEVWLATEKTYGAGNREVDEPSNLPHLQYWFVDLDTFIGVVFAEYPFATRVLPGFHPWNMRTRSINYLPKYLDEQLEKAAGLTQAHWIYCEGNPRGGDPRGALDPDICAKYKVTPEDYLAEFKRHPSLRHSAR
ncbi:MAG: discoidin domain-containing protein [Candidatus Hydrogenedentes bacterium]|nr:discoidin domain-containing protein [Candidatus Hydrogenedentota bacterium]